jgi:hypothetical protein
MINSGKDSAFLTRFNFMTSSTQQTTPAFEHLSSCALLLGQHGAPLDATTAFQLKHLRLWGAALSNDELMQWSLMTVPSQGYPNLMLYYRLDNDFLLGKCDSSLSMRGVESVSG